MKYLKSFKFWILFIIAFYTLLGFILIPWFLTNKVPTLLKKNIGINVDLGKAKFNPFTFELSIKDILLRDLDSHPVLGFKKIYIDYTLLGLFEKTIFFKNINIDSPKFYTRIYTDGKINLENIIPPSDIITQEKEEEKPSSIPAMILQKLSITNGHVAFDDLRGKKPFSLELGPFNFVAHDISTKEGDLNAHTFRTKINNDGELFWEGGMKLIPLSLYGELNIKNLKLPDIYDYALPNIGADLAQGSLSIHVPYQIDLSKDIQASINEAKLTLSKIKILNKVNKNKLIDIPQIELSGFNLKYPEQDVSIKSLSIDNSSVFTLLDKNFELNLAKAFEIKNDNKGEEVVITKEDNSTKPWSFFLKDANINKAYVSFVDMTLAKPVKSELRETSLHIKNISSIKNSPIEYQLVSTLNKNSNIKAEGNVIQEPLFVSSNIDLTNLHVREFVEYIKPHVNFNVKNANIYVKANIKANLSENKDIKVNASTSIKDLQVNNQKNKKLLTWDSLDVNEFNLEWPKQNVLIKSVILNNPYIFTSLDKNYELNLIKILESKDKKVTPKKDKVAQTPSKPWSFLVKGADINKAHITFEDNSLSKSVKSELRKTSLHVKNISSKKASAIDYKLTSVLNKNSNIKIAGKVIQEPLFVSSDIDLKNLHVKDFVEYIKPYVNFDIKKADINLKANVKANLDKKQDIKLFANTSIKNLHINSGNNEKLLTWKNLDINGIKYDHKPMSLEIKDLKLYKPYIRAHIAKDATTNFSNLIKESKTKKSVTKKKGKNESTSMKIKIGPMDLVDGVSDFSDFTLPFPFQTHIHDLNGHFSTLDFQTTTPSLLKLNGKIDKYGYTDIKGTLSPFNIKENAQLNVLFKNIDLNTMTPYSGKFVGYKIKSGKLSMDLKYDIKQAKLIGDNKINIDSLTLGEKVQSPDAVNLPLAFAIALLKDSEGQIDIDMPVKGDMDNPEFSYGSVIWGAVGNMITGIVTAPFKFLGAMLGIDGEELKALDFDKGSFEITSTEHEKLENLQKILGKRPAIKLNIVGQYDEKYDVLAIQEKKFDVIIKEELAKIKPSKDAKKIDNYGIALKNLYKKRFTIKRYDEAKKSLMIDDKGKEIELDVVAFNALLQNKLISAINIPKDELITLANQRASSIKDVLVTEYKIDAKRINILAPKTVGAKRDRWIESALDIAI